ncbi:MAG: GNAT family N-acetyltransferase [Thermomicrobiales bacterium]
MIPSTTVYELPVERFALAAPVFAGATFDAPYMDAVFEGRSDARIFVDDPERPGAALLCRTYEYFVGGDASTRSLHRFIQEAPAEVDVFQQFYGYVPMTPDWQARLLADHGERLVVIPRRSSHFDLANRWRTAELAITPPEDVALVPIDAALATRIDDELYGGIGRFWGGYDQFARGGFGFCAMIGETIASIAFAIVVSARQTNIDVETAPAHRRRGLAVLTCAAFVTESLRRGLQPTWDSDAANLASAALARRVGFEEDASFSELASPGRADLNLSHGLWQREERGDGITAWRRGG